VSILIFTKGDEKVFQNNRQLVFDTPFERISVNSIYVIDRVISSEQTE
jgi:hypothetical protein